MKDKLFNCDCERDVSSEGYWSHFERFNDNKLSVVFNTDVYLNLVGIQLNLPVKRLLFLKGFSPLSFLSWYVRAMALTDKRTVAKKK